MNEYTKPYGMPSAYGLLPLIKQYENPEGIEIGTDNGESAEYFLRKIETLTLHCVDPYDSYTDWNGANLGENNRADTYAMFIERTEAYRTRLVHHMETSDDAVQDFADESMDFIFIDGLHTYEQVLKDCRNYWSKLKPGGLFSGHDFNTIDGVRQAVIEFAAEVGKEIQQTQYDVWYWIKD